MPVVVGVDIGGTKVQAVVLRSGKMTGQARSRTPQGSPDEVVQGVVATIGGAIEAAGARQEDVVGVGVGFPGQFDPVTGETLGAVNLRGFESRYPLAASVSRAVNSAPVVLDNDVRTALVGEQRMGSGIGYRNFLGVFVGTGVGGGLVLDGKLRRGRGAAGEIGHTVVKDGGRECGCGRRGCLEAYAGRGRMEFRAREMQKAGKKTVLFAIMERRGRDRLASSVISAALEQGDSVAKMLVDDAVWALGISLASVQNVLDLEAIIIGGGLGDRLGLPFVKRVTESMRPHLFMDRDPPVMLTTTLGDLSGAIGAALLAAAAGTRRPAV